MHPWIGAGNHPLYPPDEGRYATVSLAMAQNGQMIVPMLHGQPHLTKPPLTYWAQALCFKALGKTEIAARIPSLVAASLTMVVLFFFARAMGGNRLGAISVGLYAVMPMTLFVSRLAVTDPVLNLFWLSTLACGWAAAQSRRTKWAALMWATVALGLLTKGPLVLVPAAVVALWLAIGRRGGDIRRLHIALGLPAACLPIALWAATVMYQYPHAAEIWRHEMLARASGSGSHREPIWYYIPFFIVGLIPATLLFPLPGLSAKWRALRSHFRSATSASLLMVAILVPFVGFSLMSGKLPTYLLPLCAPCAILAAMGLEKWLAGRGEDADAAIRPPAFGWGVTIAMAVLAIVPLGAALWFDRSIVWVTLPMTLVMPASIWLHGAWRSSPSRRPAMLAVMWLALIAGWQGLLAGEGGLWVRLNASELVNRAQDWTRLHTGEDHPTIAMYGFRDPTIDYYTGIDAELIDSVRELRRITQADGDGFLLLAEPRAWNRLAAQEPELVAQFESLGTYRRWFSRQTIMLQRVEEPAMNETGGE